MKALLFGCTAASPTPGCQAISTKQSGDGCNDACDSMPAGMGWQTGQGHTTEVILAEEDGSLELVLGSYHILLDWVVAHLTDLPHDAPSQIIHLKMLVKVLALQEVLV